MDNSKNRQNENLGVNKIGKNIRKSPLHQPNFGNNATSGRQQQPPQVYNISKNEFRDVVQQLTGSPSLSQDPPPRPPHNSPKPQSVRLQKIRPPPLPHVRPPVPTPASAPPPVPYNGTLHRPAQFRQPSSNPLHPGEMTWANTAESPISAYMRYLQNSMMDPGSRGNQVQPQPQPHPPQPFVPGNVLPYPPSSGLLPNPRMPMLPSPRFNGPIAPTNATNPPVPSIPSPQTNGPPILPSPTSQFLLPSPTGYMNFLSPRSPYPLLSPGVQFPSPFTPNFPFSPFAQSGILGPGPQPPLSPGLFPYSPSGFFPITSPRWRDQ
ncbi:protein HAIKU1-like [Gastrolobium bilobum]|uniref:protein HAIKU1-like n=1 Tax=Gastrolobium bilobum TaxID=150636 RepID=UPI002AB2D76D|nr:protein HAIKU1-like [Gastrolobium bilobum]